jgi:two-component system, cell cycle sensor histidine kinase and response regulator CckA
MDPGKLETELRQACRRLEHIVAFNPAILFSLAVVDEQVQGISWISENVYPILGYPAPAALGCDWWESNIHPDDRQKIVADTHTTLFAHGQTAHEYRFLHADGQYRWTKCRLRLIRDETGRPVEAVGVWLDVTDRKQAEEEQSKLREQLQQAQRLETVTRLAGGAAHDFNNLLTVINGHSDILLKELRSDDPHCKNVSEIKTAGERAAWLCRQLLILSRKQILQPIEVNLNAIIIEVGKMLERVIGEDIQVKYRLNPALDHILADPGQLQQALVNLVVNARDAMPSGGTLFIETDNIELGDSDAHHGREVSLGPYVRLKVSDTGIGMAPEVLSHLFEPFFTTKGPGEGTGLGLATVYGIVKQCRGSITVDSEAGHGAAFTIYLPRVERGTVVLPEPAVPVHLPTVRGTETILVVEDHEQVRKIAVRVLRDCGYKVLEAAGPEDALRQAEGHAGLIHLLLTDVVMPVVNGPQLADRIRASRPSIEVLFMSAHSEPVIQDRGVLASSFNFLQKPFSPDALAIKVREMIGLPRSTGTVLIVDDEPGVRNFLRKVLAGAGYEVFEAQNGSEAVRQMQGSEFDVVIIDLAMPGQEGIETILKLRPLHTRTRIIAMSGRFPTLLRAAKNLGADAAIAKPVLPDRLLEIVNEVMRSNTGH